MVRNTLTANQNGHPNAVHRSGEPGYRDEMSTYEAVSVFLASGSLAVSAVAFGGLLWQVVLIARGAKAENVHKRQQATVDFMSASLDRIAAMRSRGLPDHWDSAAIGDLIRAAKDGDAAANTLIADYLSVFSFLAVGIRRGTFDENLAADMWATRMPPIWENYQPWVTARRTATHRNVYASIEELAGRMRIYADEHDAIAP